MAMKPTLLQALLAAVMAPIAWATCTYPNAGSIAEKQAYFACLSAACEDTTDATVSLLSSGDETSCTGALAGIWTCDADISMTVVGVPGSTVKDMCPDACGACEPTTMTTTMTPEVPTSMCTYPSDGSVADRESYIECLSSACEDAEIAVLFSSSEISIGWSCTAVLAGGSACDWGISQTIAGPDSTVKDMCPATCNGCARATTVTTTTTSATLTSAPTCTYPSDGSVADRESYFECLSSACEDAEVPVLFSSSEISIGWSCTAVLAGGFACDHDISQTVAVPDSTVEDMCPATCNDCAAATTPTTTTATSTRTTQFLSPTAAPVCAYASHSNTAVKRKGTGGDKLKLSSYHSESEYLDACKAGCNADSNCKGFVDDPTDRRGRMCKPKVSARGYRKSKKTFHVKGSGC